MNQPPSIDAALVARLVTAQFPQWSGLPIRPVEPGGWDNRTFRLGADMAVRLPSAAWYAPQVAKEHRWLPVLAPHLPLPIPAPIAMGCAGEGYPWPWSIRSWLAGRPLAEVADIDLILLAEGLGAFLAALHRIDSTDGSSAGPENGHRGGRLAVYDAEVRDALDALGDHIDGAAARVVWEDALASRWEKAPVWVHGDMAAGNLLVRGGRLAAVIDFGGLAVGDPACDLAVAWTVLDDAGRQALRRALPLDRPTWARGRGWALWKALIVASGFDANQRDVALSWSVIETAIRDHETGI